MIVYQAPKAIEQYSHKKGVQTHFLNKEYNTECVTMND